MTLSGRHYLTPLFEPQSVAVVGGSPIAGKVGGVLVANLKAAGYGGKLYVVNPRYTEVNGIACFPAIAALPEPVDLAVVATPAATVPEVMEQCGARGIRNAVVLTAGFSEIGPEGAEREKALVAAARRNRVRVLGPNCVGLMRPSIGLNATFARGQALCGSLGLVSQSGAVCTAMLDWATPAGVGFSSMISLGGSADLDFGEAIDYLASDPKTEHILLYIEGVRDGRRLMGSLRAAARAKPVIVMKSGRHPTGSRAAVSHTGAIVGTDDVFDAAMRRAGVVRVANIGQLVAAAQALSSHVHPRGNRLAVITNGGGPGVVAADLVADLGIELAALSEKTVERLQAALPPHWSHGNPVDLIGDADAARYSAAVAACLDDPGVDGLLTILTPQAMTDADAAARAVIEAARGHTKPVIACWMGEASTAEARKRLQASGIPVFRTPDPAVETFAHLADFYRSQRALLEAPGPLTHVDPPDLEGARALIAAALAEGRTLLDARESKQLLAAFAIPVALPVAAASVEQAVQAAGAMGYPVVMKIDSPDITHKSDVDGVRLGVANAEQVRGAWKEIREAAALRRPGARITGVFVEPMVNWPSRRELMVGIAHDAVFGPAITFGAGGIAVEVLRDRAVALPPLNAKLVADMVQGTRVAKTLGAFRNLPPVDEAALHAVLLRVSEMACELPEIGELDINPLIADARGVIALDARVAVRPSAAGRKPYAHLAIAPYPAELALPCRLRDGSVLTLRPIRPEDADIERAFVDGLSDRSRQLRFLGALRSLTPAMLARFTQIDYDREMAFVAVRLRDGREEQVGVCRYVTLPDAETCEYAIAVADDMQGRGLGWRMMTRLVEVARSRGLKTMEGHVDAHNGEMLDLCARLGFSIAAAPDDAQLRRVALDLTAPQSARPLRIAAD